LSHIEEQNMPDRQDHPKIFSREAGGDGCEIRVVCETVPDEPADCYERIVGGEGGEFTVVHHREHEAAIDPGHRAPVYLSNEDLPPEICDQLPSAVQTVYRQAYNEAWETHVMPLRRGLMVSHDAAAKRAAWAAVRRLYTQVGTTWILRRGQ
jgi:cation transport regulator ChaB